MLSGRSRPSRRAVLRGAAAALGAAAVPSGLGLWPASRAAARAGDLAIERTLANGLRVVFIPDRRVPILTQSIVY